MISSEAEDKHQRLVISTAEERTYQAHNGSETKVFQDGL